MGVKIPFRRELEFEYGAVAELSPLIRRVIANNPSPFTLHGTGTYILGHGDVAVIDPGPADPQHIEAILAATQGERISHCSSRTPTPITRPAARCCASTPMH